MPRSNKRSGSMVQFPVRLYEMMEFVETQGLDSAIGWVLGGRGFMIHNPEKLTDVLPLFFGQTKYKSFPRQLNNWDFERISHGPNKGTYMHPYFVKGNRELCDLMSRRILKDKPGRSARDADGGDQQVVSAGSSNGELGTIKSQITECSQYLVGCWDLPPNSRTSLDDLNNGDHGGDRNSNTRSCATTRGSGGVTAVHSNQSSATSASRKRPRTKRGVSVATEDKQEPMKSSSGGGRGGSDLSCKSYSSNVASWLLPSTQEYYAQQYDAILLEPSPIAPSIVSSSRTNTLSTIRDVLEENADLIFKNDDDDSATANKKPSAYSSSDEGGVLTKDDIRVESDASEMDEDGDVLSCFAGKRFFLVVLVEDAAGR
jgi:hypothetical protein